MELEGANVTSNVNITEMPTTMETVIAMEVATSSNGNPMITPNISTIQTPNTMVSPIVVEVSTSSKADTKITANVYAMESMDTMETPIVMELSSSSKVNTEMMIDGSSSDAMLEVMVDEREENAGNSPLLQDDMFSLDELSVVENQQLDEETTVYSADIVTSMSDHCYESLIDSSQLDNTITGSGENANNDLQGVTLVTELLESLIHVNDTIEKQNIEQVFGHAANGSIGDLENDNKCIDHIPNPGDASTGHDAQVKDHTNNIPNMAVTTTHVVELENKIENGHVLPLEGHDVAKANASIDDKNEMEFVHGNQITLSESQAEAVKLKEMNEAHSTQTERAGMKEEQGSFNEQEFEKASIKEEENDYKCTGHDGQDKDDINNIPNISLAATHVVDLENKIENGHLLPLEVYDVANASIDDNNERESMHGNQVILSKSQAEVVMLKEINDTDSTQTERAGMKEEQEFKRASIKEEESCQQNLPKRIPCVIEAELEVKQHSEDKKLEEMEIPISGLAVSSNEGCVYMDIDHPSQGPSENLVQSKNIPQEIESIKEETDLKEISPNVMLGEKASEISSKITNQNINLKEANAESHAEHTGDKYGDQLQKISEEFESLKGRKVSKKFGRKKFLGEVIGYDPTTKWFKVLYEDGDEEEVEKNELDSILLPLDGKLVASRKRRLPANEDGHEDANRTGRKLIKLNTQATSKEQGNNETVGDEITGLNRISSSSKKRKSYALKSGGKSKSPKVSVPKTRKAKNQASSGKKSIEKEKSEKKSQAAQSKKSNNRTKQSSSKKAINLAQNEDQSVTRKLKYGSAMKKSSTKKKQKAKEIPPKDKKVMTPQLSMAEKSAAATSGRKRKFGTDVQGTESMVSGKRARKEVVNDVESSPLRKMESRRRRIAEDSAQVSLQEKAKINNANDDSISLPTGKRYVRSDKGSVLVGRKVRKDFGGSLFGGEIVGYKMYYNVKYDDGDTEDLTWKELEQILLPEQEGSSQPKQDKHNTSNKVNSVKSKPKKKN